MSLRSSVANGGAAKSSSSSPPDDGGMVPLFQRRPDARLTSGPGQEKQKKLLAADAGHFSMIKSVANFPPLPLLHPFKLQTNKQTNCCESEQGITSRRFDHRTQWSVHDEFQPYTHALSFSLSLCPALPTAHFPPYSGYIRANGFARLLRLHVHPLVHALLPRPRDILR